MPGKHKLRRLGGFDYFPLFRRIEEKFLPEELDSETLKEYLNAKTSGMESLAEQLAQTREISLQIEESEDIGELRELRKEVNKLEVHRGTLVERIEEKIVALSIVTAEEFAEERKIRLTERVTGNIEVWKDGKERLVIRENGHFKAWRRL
jgi:hypothetical protein